MHRESKGWKSLVLLSWFIASSEAQVRVSTITVNRHGSVCHEPTYTYAIGGTVFSTTLEASSTPLAPMIPIPVNNTLSVFRKCVDNVCPAMNDASCRSQDGSHYEIHCDTSLQGLVSFTPSLGKRAYAEDFTTCLARCDADADCDGVSYFLKNCLVYGSVIGDTWGKGFTAAVKIRKVAQTTSASVPFVTATGNIPAPGIPVGPAGAFLSPMIPIPTNAPFPMQNATTAPSGTAAATDYSFSYAPATASLFPRGMQLGRRDVPYPMHNATAVPNGTAAATNFLVSYYTAAPSSYPRMRQLMRRDVPYPMHNATTVLNGTAVATNFLVSYNTATPSFYPRR